MAFVISVSKRERESEMIEKKKKEEEEEEDRNVKRVNCVFMDINKQIGQIGR